MLTLIALVIALLLLDQPWSIVLVVGAALVDLAEIGAFVWWSRRRRRLGPVAVGIEVLVGRTGVVLTRLEPKQLRALGQVRINGEIWAARSATPIDPGEAVTVISVEELVLVVESSRRE